MELIMQEPSSPYVWGFEVVIACVVRLAESTVHQIGRAKVNIIPQAPEMICERAPLF